jgi:Na+-translocating ferredoxin:NAD+ oxidoreductase subunit B
LGSLSDQAPTRAAAQALAARLHAALPQTQCTRCGYPDCAAYAQAIACNEASTNQCAPGGSEGIARLAAITGQAPLPLNPEHGTEGPRSVALIDEAWCIGCTLCLPVCPTDAILGSNKQMHTVIQAHCTGCELCLPVCPVDCIALVPVSGSATGWAAWSAPQADSALRRYTIHSTRSAKYADGRPIELETTGADVTNKTDDAEHKRATIAAALARARAARA